ncbi:MAG TPA: CBASS oligonucleotide cyclase [Gaiellaceae bacterium]|jgi:hypothetical protein|nr:CBASS oligonucleotide cyclase [Gaiellaceae bacterium]
MSYVDDAFAKCKSTLETTKSEEETASRRHNEIRTHVERSWQLEDHFLTGSYRRRTKTKRLKDVDIFVVIDPDGPQHDLRGRPPAEVLEELRKVLATKYSDVVPDGFACVVSFGQTEDVTSFDVVPAFKRNRGGWEIPDAERGTWIATNPKTHHEQLTKKNEACDGKFVPFVKMVKGINREAGEPIPASFLLEVMAHGLVREPFGRYQDEVTWFLASAADGVEADWADPAGLGPPVNNTMTARERARAADTFRGWHLIADEAVRLEDAGRERDAVEQWQRLFGKRMPQP